MHVHGNGIPKPWRLSSVAWGLYGVHVYVWFTVRPKRLGLVPYLAWVRGGRHGDGMHGERGRRRWGSQWWHWQEDGKAMASQGYEAGSRQAEPRWHRRQAVSSPAPAAMAALTLAASFPFFPLLLLF